MIQNADQLAQEQLDAVTGVQLAQGIGHQPARGFWTEAWSQVFARPAAIAGIAWVGIVTFFAIFSPLIASGHPVIAWDIAADGSRGAMHSPMIQMLTGADVTLIIFGVFAPIFIFIRTPRLGFSKKMRLLIAGAAQMGIAVIVSRLVESYFTQRDSVGFVAEWGRNDLFAPVSALVVAAISAIPFLLISVLAHRSLGRVLYVIAVVLVSFGVTWWKWSPDLNNYDYRARESASLLDARYTLIPLSPNQSETAMFNREPGATPMNALWDRLEQWQRRLEDRSARYNDEELGAMAIMPEAFEELHAVSSSFDSLVSDPMDAFVDDLQARQAAGEIDSMLALRNAIVSADAPSHALGTDTLGQDVLAQMLHACRLAISIGFVSTGIAVVIGVTIGSLMGYFGGWVDLLLYRVVEIFMAIPVLFLLIVAAGLLPRNTYVMMAIIGCFTWTGAARFIRAEFMKLRETDYVQAAKAMGLPLWSILFKHMLPNGVTPVLVESSFLIAAAILIEATLSFLGLGPSGQASWGSLLRNASGEAGGFIWWLAIVPGAAIFLTTLAYNLIGEALRDAIDPKLKKARV
jgi:ABC-type dipeptide/oligopeptide/nickel transport system permease subunit